MSSEETTLVLGLGNVMLGDDAAGPLAVQAMAADPRFADAAVYRDGGTIGLSLLPEIEDAGAFIAVDAAEFGAEPGVVRVFEGAAMDAQLGGRKRSAHEVALFDLMAVAEFAGRLPARRALVAVQPASTAMSLSPSPAVAAAIPQLCVAVHALLARWQSQAKETVHV